MVERNTLRDRVAILGVASGLVLSATLCHAGRRNLVTDPLDGGLAGHVQVDWDGARESGADFRLAAEVELGDWTRWVRLSADSYGATGSPWKGREDSFAALEAGRALWRDHEHRFYLNAILQMDSPSLLSSRGVDLSPQLGIVHGLTPQWWIGAEAGGVIATSPEDGYRRTYPFANLWIVWLPGASASSEDSGLQAAEAKSDESDQSDDEDESENGAGEQSVALNLWLSGTDDADASGEAALSLEYRRDLTDSLELILGVEVRLAGESSPALSASAGLRWDF